jgi:hypothetical protein
MLNGNIKSTVLVHIKFCARHPIVSLFTLKPGEDIMPSQSHKSESLYGKFQKTLRYTDSLLKAKLNSSQPAELHNLNITSVGNLKIILCND